MRVESSSSDSMSEKTDTPSFDLPIAGVPADGHNDATIHAHGKETTVVDYADPRLEAALPQSSNAEIGGRLDLLKVLTRTSTGTLDPPPDGGWNAWTQTIMTHLVIMNTWGFINSFGVFQTYYVDALNTTPSDISWIGSIQVFLLFGVGTFTGRLTDAGYFHQVFILGSLMQVFGLFMVSLSTEYWQLFLAQGVCCGLGNGCLFCPAISVVSTYFTKKRAIALGITAAGSATGGLIFPAMVQQLLPQIGFGWTIRTIAFIQLLCLTIANIFIRQRVPPRNTGPILDLPAFKELPYLLFAIGMFFNFWGVYFAFYYVGSFARNVLGMTYSDSISVLLVMNGVGVIGRVLPNYAADRRFGPLNLLIPSTLFSGVLAYCWIAVKDEPGLYVWDVFYGIVGAAVQGLFPATLSTMTTDLRKMGTRMGQVFTIVSFAVLTGPPIGGALVQQAGGQYYYSQIFAGTALAISTVLLTGSRIAKVGPNLFVRC